MTDVTKVTAYLPFSRELLIDEGLIEPTPEEAAERAQRAAEAEVRTASYEQALARFRVELAASENPVARAVLDLHADDYGDCKACVDDTRCLPWPCATVEAVASALGVEVPEW